MFSLWQRIYSPSPSPIWILSQICKTKMNKSFDQLRSNYSGTRTRNNRFFEPVLFPFSDVNLFCILASGWCRLRSDLFCSSGRRFHQISLIGLGWLTGIDPVRTLSQSVMLPLHHNHHYLDHPLRFERRLFWFKARRFAS